MSQMCNIFFRFIVCKIFYVIVVHLLFIFYIEAYTLSTYVTKSRRLFQTEIHMQ